MKRTILAVATIISLLIPAIADDAKWLSPRYPGAGNICPAGQAMTYQMQCDPGSRAPIDEVWGGRMPGVSICRIQRQGCRPLEAQNAKARTGYEVRDAVPADEMVGVIFGLERLLGEW
jgi:hypothetical protein